MQNQAASLMQLPFLGPISSAANGNPSGAPNSTTTNANSGSHPEQDQENGGSGQESQFGLGNANLEQFAMFAAAAAAANSNAENNALHKFYLSQMQSASSNHQIDPGTNLAMGNSTGDVDTLSQQTSIPQAFFETLFNPQQNQHPTLTPQVSAAELMNGSKMQQMGQSLGNSSDFGDMTPEQWAQLMSIIGGQQQSDLKESAQNRQMTHGPTHKISGQSGVSSGDSSQPISPNGQQINATPSQLFEQLQLLGILGGTSVPSSLNPADLFTSSNSFMNTTANSALSQAFANNNSSGGNDFASLAASLNMNLTGGGASHGPSMDTSNNVAAVQAALLAATSGSFSQANFPGSSPNKSLDSYCEICDKNLCNRYFLKTHKLKKHGIADDGTTGSPVKTSFAQSQGSFDSDTFGNHARSTTTQAHSSVIVSSGQNAGSLDHDSDRHGSGDSSPLAKMPKLSSCSTSSTSSMQQNMMANLMNGAAGGSANTLNSLFGSGKSALELLNSFGIMANGQTEQRTPTKSPADDEQFNLADSENNASNHCNYCDKDCGTRMNLLQHQILQHGGNSISTTFQRAACGSPLSSSTGATHGGSTSGNSEANPNLQSQLNNNFLNNLLPGMPLPFLLPQQLAQFGGDLSDPQALLAKLAATPSGGVPSPTAPGSGQGQTPKLAAKRQYSSTSKNYCDLCKKEVCNKYFLRTHMLKMHNIVIDENKSVIANIDTLEKERSGSISFRCDICLLDLKTRNDLRHHKRENHGVVPILTPPHSAGSQQSTPSRKSGIHTALGASGPSMVSQPQKFMGQRFFGQPISDQMINDEDQLMNDEETKLKVGSEDDAGTSALENVKMILNSITGGKLDGENPLGQALSQVKKEAEGSEDANSMDNNVPSSSASSTFEAANSATSSASVPAVKCDICNQEFTDLLKLQFHNISQHFLSALPQNDGNDIITRVALQMAKANQAQSQSGKSGMSNNPILAATAQHICTHCNRQYKSKLALQNHTKLVHHNFVAKLSPNKKTKRPVISPKKVKKLRSSFTCMKCQRRFSTRAECSEHVIAHLKAEKEKENLQNQPFNGANSGQSLGNTSPATKMFRSNSFGNGNHKGQDSNNNSPSIHACRSLPMESTELGEREKMRRMSQPIGLEQSLSKSSEFDDNLLRAFIQEDFTDEELDAALTSSHTQLTLEMPENGPTPTSVAGAAGIGSAHPSSGCSSYDDGYLMIDANSEANDAVDQVVSEIHQERCRRQSHHNLLGGKEEKHSHTPEEQSSDQSEESESGGKTSSAEHMGPSWSPAPESSYLSPTPPQQCNWAAGSAPGVVSQSSPHVQMHQC